MHTLVQKGMTAHFHTNSIPLQPVPPCMPCARVCDVPAGCLAVFHLHNSCSAGSDAAKPRVSRPTCNASLH